MEISSQEKKELLQLARLAIKNNFLTEQEKPKFDKNNPLFYSKAGAFVTLTINHKLRGCIGYVEAYQPLYKTIMEAAFQAAFNDPRFSPLSKEEYSRIKIEVSILSEPFPLENYDEIVVGKHGLILEEGTRKGLLLPQVPIEHNMNKEEYLSALCNKAGFYPDYWKEKQLKLKAFTATVFSESEGET